MMICWLGILNFTAKTADQSQVNKVSQNASYILICIQVFRGISEDNNTLMKKPDCFPPYGFTLRNIGLEEEKREAAILALLSLT